MNNKALVEGKNNNKLRDLARINFERWCSALLTKDPKIVSSLYSNNAILFPTLLGEIKVHPEGIEEYFKHFLLKSPICELTEDFVISNGDNSYSHNGTYNFEVGPMDKREPLKARFSFNWAKLNGEWKIQMQHSSVLP